MSGAEIIALASVIGTALVGLTSPWIVARFGLKRFVLEASKAREEELREHLDLAAVRLIEARVAVGHAVQQLLEVAATQTAAVVAPRASLVYGEFKLSEQKEQLAKNAVRLGVRLGSSSDVTTAYQLAVNSLHEIVDALGDVAQGQDHPSGQWTHTVEAHLDSARGAQDQFHDAASAVIGLQSLADARRQLRRRRKAGL